MSDHNRYTEKLLYVKTVDFPSRWSWIRRFFASIFLPEPRKTFKVTKVSDDEIRLEPADD